MLTLLALGARRAGRLGRSFRLGGALGANGPLAGACGG